MYNRHQLSEAILSLVTLKIPETEEAAFIEEMSRNILDPEWMNYIYQTNEFCDSKGALDIETVCTKILSYRPIWL